MLPPKLKPCESTWEVSPDPISQQANVWAKRYESFADVTQVRDKFWRLFSQNH